MITMLKEFHSICDVSYDKIMRLYEQSILDYGRERFPHMDEYEQRNQAEQDLYQYLRYALHNTGAVLCIWESEGEYKAALRLEQYRDGVLISGLEAAPAARGLGYATALLGAVCAVHRNDVIYSHVDKWNLASMRVHEKCGFKLYSNSAVYLDGSASRDAYTLVFMK